MISIGIISHGTAFFAFSALTMMLLLSNRKNALSGSLIVASTFSALWAVIAAVQSTITPLFWAFGGILDSMRILVWAYFLCRVLDTRISPKREEPENLAKESFVIAKEETHSSSKRLVFAILSIAAAHLCIWALGFYEILPIQSVVRLIATLWILASVVALFSLERFIRATPSEKIPSIKYLIVGLGAMFIFDFFVFTDTQLFGRIDTNLWFARGFGYAIVAPMIALAIARNPQWSVEVHVSRQAVTSSITAIAGGGYLLITAAAAYFVRLSGVEWASVAEVVVILLAVVVLALLAFSTRLRSRLRVFVSKHLFNFKYDYRHEWLKFTDTLASQFGDTPKAVLEGLTGLVDGGGGIVWQVTDKGKVEIIKTQGKITSDTLEESDATAMWQFVLRTQWLIELDEFRKHPKHYEGMLLSQTLLNEHKAWLVLPLFFRDELIACVLFERSTVKRDINWEDRDLLKTAGRQAGTLLKHEQTQVKLAEASQFQAFSKLSAYIVHDLKNIIGQQSLLVSNAARHKHNPEFVEDVVSTVDHSVTRMKALLEQLRTNRTDEEATTINIEDILKKVVANRAVNKPAPTLEASNLKLLVTAEPERLQRVFSHIVQNAQEATPANGTVTINIKSDANRVIVSIQDTGTGMTHDFIRHRLFKAFESTKGLTGMGIGMFESREYVNSLEGDIAVTSKTGEGTVFLVRLQLANQNL